MVRHLRKPGHPRRRRLVSYRPPVRSITPRQPPGRSGSPPSPPLLSTFFPLSPSPPLLFCSIFSLLCLLPPSASSQVPPPPSFRRSSFLSLPLFSFLFSFFQTPPLRPPSPSILLLPVYPVFSFSLILFHPSSSTRLLRSTFLLLLRLFSPSPSRATASSSFSRRPTASLCSPRRGSCFPPSSTLRLVLLPPLLCAFASFACQPSVSRTRRKTETVSAQRPEWEQERRERDVPLCPRVGSNRQPSGSKGRGDKSTACAPRSQRLRTYISDIYLVPRNQLLFQTPPCSPLSAERQVSETSNARDQ